MNCLASAIVRHAQGDMVFMSPPWGGPGYNKLKAFNVNADMPLAAYVIRRQ